MLSKERKSETLVGEEVEEFEELACDIYKKVKMTEEENEFSWNSMWRFCIVFQLM